MSKEPTELEQSQIEVNQSQSDKTRVEMIIEINKNFRHKVLFWTFYMTLPFTLMGQIKANLIVEVLKWIK